MIWVYEILVVEANNFKDSRFVQRLLGKHFFHGYIWNKGFHGLHEKTNKKLTNISCIVKYVVKNEYKHLRSLVQMLIGLVVV
jgi:hypothetical protein